MTRDKAFEDLNRQSTNRIRKLAKRLSDEDLQKAVGEHWTIAVTFAHIAFWDERVLAILDASEKAKEPVIQAIDIVVNDLSLPFWLAFPPRQAVEMAIVTAEKLDQRLENYAPELLEQLSSVDIRYIRRDIHRIIHLEEIEQAIGL